MPQQRIIVILALIANFLLTSIPANALFITQVSPDNLEETVASILELYREDLMGGIGKDSLTNYLKGLLPDEKLNDLCNYPEAQIDSTTVASHFFSWLEINGAIGYAMSCINFSNGNSGYIQLEENQIIVDRVDDAVCLYAFLSICSTEKQSIVRIIIVDKDIVNNGNPQFQIPPPNPRSANFEVFENNISISPNPFYNELFIELSLLEDTPIKLHLLNDYRGASQVLLLFDEPLSAGEHKLQINLPRLATGWYYGILEIDGKRQFIPLVKI